ncbi:MAG TPA: SDR family oxidoreductase [Micromonosporaceae bacterium]|nr:SDR family oxidoreductase [Micromonosporaceae bacterium]
MADALTGRVAVVTGASRRQAIGAAVARRLAADGASVFLPSWPAYDAETTWGADDGGPEGLVEELRAGGAKAVHHGADFADPGAPAEVIAAARDAFGHVDILVANHARSHRQGLEELTATEIDLSFAVNTRATLLLIQAYAAQHDDTRPGGRVVLFTSGQYHGAMPDELPYIAAKAALHELTPSLAVHLARRSITVNCVNPGPNDSGWAPPEVIAESADRIPGGRWSTPRDTARLVGWIVSDDAEWITGQTIASDGGWSAR